MDRMYACGVLAMLLLVSATGAASAQDLARLRACAAEADEERRLACYDREVAALPPEPSAADASSSARASGEQGASQEEFGLRGSLERKAREEKGEVKVERVTLKVTELARKPRGEVIVTLENGQVWAQRDASTNLNVRVGDTVTIREGSLGSYWLSTVSRQSALVMRLK